VEGFHLDESEPVRRVLVCLGLFCSAQGSGRVLAELQAALDGQTDIAVERYYCFNGCGHGPNVVLHPGHAWYEGVKPNDVFAIVAHAQTGQPASRDYGSRVPATVKANTFELIDRQYAE
jgi:(2Fe-2S) ferredoxin